MCVILTPHLKFLLVAQRLLWRFIAGRWSKCEVPSPNLYNTTPSPKAQGTS